ncbi:MAG TPA: protein kinase [Blastocatellia bacterium]|nr:protein kinase [Blastocatellia bacterium]HMV86026.1 protein kinase [Blastocatellia bacterium]HMX25288.1 protein kinase [Blastocatellia bacterium]HMY70587.1 protein kinase [Blastocatellia bacterium]HMZ21579.1 protein kinase [Blastocatellia bacterium]
MNPERWKKLDDIFQAAVSLPLQERVPYVARACGEDEALRREIESLLAAQSEAQSYFSPSLKTGETTQPLTEIISSAPTASFVKAPPPSAQEPSVNPWFWRCSLAGIVIVAGLHVILGWITFHRGTQDRFGMRMDFKGSRLIVVLVDPGGPAAGKIQEGDEILATNGDGSFGRINPPFVWREIHPGQFCTFLVKRQGTRLQIPVDSAWYHPKNLGARWRFWLFGYSRGLVFLIVALLIVLMRGQDEFAKISAPAFISLGVLNLAILLLSLPALNGWEVWVELAIYLLGGGYFFIPLGFHTAAVFPPGADLTLTRFWRWLRNALYVIGGVLCTAMCLYQLGPHNEALTAFLFRHEDFWIHFFRRARELFYPLGLLCLCVMLLRNFLRVRDLDHRRRMKLMVFGNLVMIVPIAGLEIANQAINLILGASTTWRKMHDLLLWGTDSSSVLIPMVWGYAMVTRRIYPAKVILRRGLQYLLARNALRAMLLLPALLLIYQILSHPDQTIRDLFFAQPLSFGLIVLFSLSLMFRKQLRGWLDGQFFRAQVNQERVLYQLIEEIKEFDDLSDLCRRVRQRLEETLHPEHTHFLFRRSATAEWESSSSPDAQTSDFSFAPELVLFDLMKNRQAPLDFPFERGRELPASERQRLEQRAIQLIVPMNDSENQLAGVLLLGEKKSEEPYDPNDRRLLLAIARQIATAVEVGQLRAQIRRRATSERQVLARLDAAHINLLRECPQCGLCFDSAQDHCSDCQVELTLSLPVERTIDERYRLERLLGKGGMGAVYAATDLRLRRAVAVKLIHADYFGDKKLLRRFEQEAQTAARLNHPNIVKVFDYGRTQTGGVASSGAWLVMELVQGTMMRDELNRLGRLSPELAADWFAQLLDGLNAAHQAAIIHRDLKPENILLSRNAQGQKQLQILDFGLAKLRESSAQADNDKGLTTLTKPGMIVGTLFYMSPEQLSGKTVRESSDIFTIGVMLAEALTGRRPFDGKTPTDVLEAIWHNPFSLHGESEALVNLNRVIQRCLMVNPLHRFQTVEELKAELIPALLACAGTTNLEARPVTTHPASLPTQGYSHKDFKTGDHGE